MASGKSSTTAANFQKILYQAVAWANVADNAASSPLTNLYCALHTGTLNASSVGNTSEAAYTSYARVAVARSTGGWDITNAVINPHATVSFPAATGGSETETYASVSVGSSGTSVILHWGALTTSLPVVSGVTPSFSTSNLTITES